VAELGGRRVVEQQWHGGGKRKMNGFALLLFCVDERQ